MATTREQFIQLRKSGVDPLKAKEEVMKTIAPITPSNTTNANIAQLESNKARVQSQIASAERPAVGTSVTPQAGQTQAPTPVLPTAPTETPSGATMAADGTVTPAPVITTPATTVSTTPVTPATVETPTPAPVTQTTPVIDKNAEIKAKNEAKLAENKQKAQLAEQTRQQSITEQNNQLANNEGAILNSIKTGGIIPESVKSSPFYKSAQQTYNKLQQYSTYSTNELVTAMNQGSIVPGTNVYNEMMKDPVMKQKLTDAQIYRAGDPVNSTQIYENASSEIMSNNPTTANYLADGIITQAEYDQATNNAQVVAKAKEVEEKANKYNTLKAEYDSIEDEVNAQFPGSPFADSIIADRQKAKYKNLVLAKGEWETATGTLTELKSQASTLFETNLNLAEKRREEQNTIAAEQRNIQQQKDMLQYKSDFEKKQAQEALNDPYKAIPTMIEEYKKLGIPFIRSTQQIIQDFESSGQDLSTYLSELQGTIQSKPEYKKYQELQQGQLSDAQKIAVSQNFDLKKMGMEQNFQMQLAQAKQTTNNKWTKLDDGMYTNEAGEIITADELKTAKLANNSYITKPVGAEGGECGFYASRATGMSSTPGGNSKEARTQAFSDKTPEIGGMAFFGGPGYDKTYGHIGIVTGVNQENGTVTIKDSNYGNDLKVRERTVPASSITGYYNNTPLAQGINAPTGTQATPQYTDDVIAVLSLAGDMTNTAEAKKTLKENGLTTQDLARFKAGTIPATAGQKTQATNVVTQINDMLAGDALSDAVGMAKTPGVFGGTERKDFEAKFASFRDNLALSNIDKLKGAMSDKDIEFLRNTASSLNLDMSEAEFIKQLNLIKAKYANIAGGGPTNVSNTAPAPIGLSGTDLFSEWSNFNK